MTKTNKFIYWTPRVLGVLFVLFLMLFSLDVFTDGQSLWQMTLGFLIHNIPTFILSIILFISWKHDLFGAITFNLAGLLYLLVLILSPNFKLFMLLSALVISLPAFFIGILFLLNWSQKHPINK